jgi:hypothetical protein
MNRTMKRIGTAALAVTTALTGTVVFATSPALAATKCSAQQSNEFDTNGFNVDIKISLCVKTVAEVNGRHVAYAKGSWGDGGPDTRKFNMFNIHVRLERNNDTKATYVCDLTSSINLYESGTFGKSGDSHDIIHRCWALSDSGLDGGWTADGYIKYDITDDGEHAKTWSLHGSPGIN